MLYIFIYTIDRLDIKDMRRGEKEIEGGRFYLRSYETERKKERENKLMIRI